MSIRDIAREFYCLHKEVEKLKYELQESGREKKETIREKLRKAKAEKNKMKRILDGAIDR